MPSVGEIFVNSKGKTFTIIGVDNSKSYKRYKIEFLETGYQTLVHSSDIYKGLVRDKLEPSVCGVGCLGYSTCKGHSKEYRLWTSMLGRCYNNLHEYYYNYGGRGIYVCDRWLRFDSFLEDLPKVEGYDEYSFRNGKLELDKDIKGYGYYSLETCTFVTRKENSNHKRGNGKGIPVVAIKGNSKLEFSSVISLCKELELSKYSVHNALKKKQLYKGWKIVRRDEVC